MKQYDLMLGEHAVGVARITREGLYLSVKCRCRLTDSQVHRVYLICDDCRTIDLGICIPMEDCFGINTKIPAKGIDLDQIRFCLDQNEIQTANKTEEIPVSCTQPIPCLSDLESARFSDESGTSYIILER